MGVLSYLREQDRISIGADEQARCVEDRLDDVADGGELHERAGGGDRDVALEIGVLP